MEEKIELAQARAALEESRCSRKVEFKCAAAEESRQELAAAAEEYRAELSDCRVAIEEHSHAVATCRVVTQESRQEH